MPEPWEYPVTRRVLSKQSLPSGPFDPAGAWKHSYSIYFMNVRTKRGNSAKRPLRPAARVDINSAPDGRNVHLSIAYTANMDGDRTVTGAACRANALLSPMAWTQSFTNGTAAGKGLVSFEQKGSVTDGRLRLDGREPSVSWGLGEYTADWCLLDAVQRLAAAGDQARRRFDLIEEFSILRAKQVLFHRGTSTVETADGKVPAQVYCHYGESVIPTLYYVDPHHRLFLVLSTRRTIILNEEG